MAARVQYTKTFAEVGGGDVETAGGKGAALGEMTRAGIPVPPGFVILAPAFQRFLEESSLTAEIDRTLAGVRLEEMGTAARAAERIQALMLAAEVPLGIARVIQQSFLDLDVSHVAVRSSATAEDGAVAAWAGQLESYLNTTAVTLLENVQRCWASLFTSRAICYRLERGFGEQKISVAVIVQQMIQSEVSGTAFSVHPVTEDSSQLIIEAGFGLGEAIVSGQVTPDSYVVEKSSRRTIGRKVSAQRRALVRASGLAEPTGVGGTNRWHELGPRGSTQKLSDEQILELAELVLRIERHYGYPCDIEWAYGGGTFSIVQSRPITTLGSGARVA